MRRTLLTIVAALAVLTSQGHAQGTGGRFVEPMTWPECRAMIMTLDASRDQMDMAADAVMAVLTNPEPFRRAWLVEAFPRVAEQDPFLQRYETALDAPDLSLDQRASIATLRAEHLERWWSITDEMIAVQQEDVTPNLVDSSDVWAAHERIMQRLDAQRFQRREAALKGLEALRSVLSEQQLASLEGLMDPPERQGFPLSF